MTKEGRLAVIEARLDKDFDPNSFCYEYLLKGHMTMNEAKSLGYASTRSWSFDSQKNPSDDMHVICYQDEHKEWHWTERKVEDVQSDVSI
jgi:hypothetical protein